MKGVNIKTPHAIQSHKVRGRVTVYPKDCIPEFIAPEIGHLEVNKEIQTIILNLAKFHYHKLRINAIQEAVAATAAAVAAGTARSQPARIDVFSPNQRMVESIVLDRSEAGQDNSKVQTDNTRDFGNTLYRLWDRSWKLTERDHPYLLSDGQVKALEEAGWPREPEVTDDERAKLLTNTVQDISPPRIACRHMLFEQLRFLRSVFRFSDIKDNKYSNIAEALAALRSCGAVFHDACAALEKKERSLSATERKEAGFSANELRESLFFIISAVYQAVPVLEPQSAERTSRDSDETAVEGESGEAGAVKYVPDEMSGSILWSKERHAIEIARIGLYRLLEDEAESELLARETKDREEREFKKKSKPQSRLTAWLRRKF